MDLEAVLSEIDAELKAYNRDQRSGSTYLGPNATREAVEEVRQRQTKAASGEAWRTAPRSGGGTLSGRDFLVAIKQAASGDPQAHVRLRGLKSWSEADGESGGWLVRAEQLPTLIPARKAAAPILDHVARTQVSSNEVWILTEGDAVSVEPVAEQVTKPYSSGTIGQLVSCVHKCAGLTSISDELFADTNGQAEALIARQFAAATDGVQAKAVINGSGIGQPTGIMNAANVNHVPVESSDGVGVYEAIVKSVSRLTTALYPPTSITMSPSVLPLWLLPRDATGQLLFPNGLPGLLPGLTIIVDPNMPTTLGESGDKTAIIVGDLRTGVMVFERDPLRIEASTHALFESDETLFRCHARYGAATVQPAALEVLDDIAVAT